MDKKSLKILRLICPGLLFLLYALPLLFRTGFIKSINQLDDYTRYLCILICIIALGAIYYILGVRNIFWRKIVMDLRNNIKNTFIDFFKSEIDIVHKIKSLSDLELMSVFYKLIDDDDSLKDKQNDVRLNGLILTTVIDAQLLLLFFMPIYLLFCILEKYYYFIVFVMILSAIIYLLLNLFKNKLKKKHFEYQNEQLIVIKMIHLDNLRKLLGK